MVLGLRCQAPATSRSPFRCRPTRRSARRRRPGSDPRKRACLIAGSQAPPRVRRTWIRVRTTLRAASAAPALRSIDLEQVLIRSYVDIVLIIKSPTAEGAEVRRERPVLIILCVPLRPLRLDIPIPSDLDRYLLTFASCGGWIFQFRQNLSCSRLKISSK